MAQFDQSLCLPASSTVGQPMYCPEYIRLRQLDEVAIRNWGLVILSPDSNSSIPLTAEIKEKACRDRDEAKRRLSDHIVTCPVCSSKRRATQGRKLTHQQPPR
jgi:hypothetical protein